MSKQKEAPKQKAEAEAASAGKALDRGDWKAALTSLAHAVQHDPFREEWSALVDRALEAGGAEANDFLKKGNHQPYIGFEGLKAYTAHRAGDFGAASNELENLTRNFPNTLFAEAWGFGWLTEDAVRGAGQTAFRFLASSVHNRYPEAEQSNDWCRKHLARAIAALERIESVLGASDQTVLFKGQMLSKSGRFQEAIEMAVKAAEANPTFRTATAAAMAHKRAGDVEGGSGSGAPLNSTRRTRRASWTSATPTRAWASGRSRWRPTRRR